MHLNESYNMGARVSCLSVYIVVAIAYTDVLSLTLKNNLEQIVFCIQ